MIYLINESSILANQIKNNVKLINLNIVSTNGFLFDYARINATNIAVTTKEKISSSFKKLIKSKKDSDIIVVATDKDPAGELIAMEILHFFPNAIRYKYRIDDLLFLKQIDGKDIVASSSKSEFKFNLAKGYLKDKMRPDALKTLYKKQRVSEYILGKADDMLVIPKVYSKIITRM